LYGNALVVRKKRGKFVNLGVNFAFKKIEMPFPAFLCPFRFQEVKKMRKKAVAIVLILGILFTFTVPAYSGWGVRGNKFGPIVIQGHPWGESNRSIYTPPVYRPNLVGGFPDIEIPGLVDFVTQFYLKYVVKQVMEEQRLIRSNGRSE